ncbi:MAG: DUF934 domain-containing protein [Gammaproteobacteria bacterium]|jgi:uncharacterized protein (DUF934 family)|nr:DUF934 domain-containing protein [Gammaproteobacteria bacterium]
MPSFNFSENTVTLDEWNELDNAAKRDSFMSRVLVVASDSRVENFADESGRFDRIVVTSSDFNDGRIFSIGRQLRLLGFTGRLTVVGDILPDQFSALKSCGFDDVLSLDTDTIDAVVDLDQSSSLASVCRQLNGNRESVLAAGNKP